VSASYLQYFIRTCLVVVLVMLTLVTFAQEEYYQDSTTVVLDSTFTIEEYEKEPEKNEFAQEIFVPINDASWRMDSIRWRNIPDSVKKGWKDHPDFWYAGQSFRQKISRQQNNNSKGSLLNASWFKAMLWILTIAGFIIFIFVVLTNNNSGLFRRSNKQLGEQESDIETDDIFAINYQREIDKAAGAGNYRLAVRLMFLRLLKNLSEKQIIQYKHDRTNFDYLVQLSATRYYNDFFRLTRNYEYSWYGHFEVNPELYKKIKTEFEQFEPAMK